MSFWRCGLFVAFAHAQSCVTKTTITPGDGVTFPKAGDTVSMHYTGTLASTGAKFDSSRDRGQEFSTQIGVGKVIQGWDQGVPQLSLGEQAILRISASCGYGARGSPPSIPANADLVFDVQLNGLNGRRAGSPVASVAPAPIAPAPIAPASFGSFGAAVAPPAALPTCVPSSCGHAISFDTTGSSRPLCLCNPICDQMKGTPGVLPCCPGLQQVCLDPYRSPSPQPPVATAATIRPAPVPIAAALPTCRPNSCSKAMASATNPTVAVCACDVSCLSPGASLPCCQSFQEVCQASTLFAPAPIQQAPANVGFSAVSQNPTCSAGKMRWAEQASCATKRWAIQNNQCKKVCNAIDSTLFIQYWATGKPGKDACDAALANCNRF